MASGEEVLAVSIALSLMLHYVDIINVFNLASAFISFIIGSSTKDALDLQKKKSIRLRVEKEGRYILPGLKNTHLRMHKISGVSELIIISAA